QFGQQAGKVGFCLMNVHCFHRRQISPVSPSRQWAELDFPNPPSAPSANPNRIQIHPPRVGGSKSDVAAFGRKPPFESLRPVCGALPSRRYGLTAWAKATKLEGVLFKKRWKCQKTGG